VHFEFLYGGGEQLSKPYFPAASTACGFPGCAPKASVIASPSFPATVVMSLYSSI
jgi:hypothetical protein